MDPTPVFEPDDGSRWFQSSDGSAFVTIMVPLDQKPQKVVIRHQKVEIHLANGSQVDHELFAQVGRSDLPSCLIFLKDPQSMAAK